jgi:hypothetical protein
MAYQVTFTLSPAYTATTVADDFTIIGLPGNVTIATGVSKTDLTNGVTYTVDDTITGGTVTSTGVCGNSVAWTGWAGPGENLGPSEPDGPTATPISPTPTPTATEGQEEVFHVFHHCGGGDPQFQSFQVAASKLITAGMVTPNPLVGDTVTISGSPNAGAVWDYRGESALSDDGVTVLTYNVETCDIKP